MGLFGGFKAKFTKNSKSKESANQSSVVPLNFKFNSEFDIGNAYPNGFQSVTKNTVSRPRAPIRSATFEDNNRTLLEKLKSRSLINISNAPSSANSSKEYQYNEQHIQKSNSVKETETRYSSNEGDKKHSVHTGNGKAKLPVKKTSSVRITSKSEERENNYGYPGPGESLHQYEQVLDEFSSNKEDSSSTLIMMTQHEPDKSTVKDKKKLEPSEMEQNTQEEFKVNVKATENDEFYDNNDLLEFKPISQQKSDEYYNNSNKKFKTKKEELEDEFKVNVVHHDQDYVSEDELSYMEEEVQSDFNGYSSQATSIFFGGSDAPPAPIRPRRVNFLKEDDDDDEMEC